MSEALCSRLAVAVNDGAAAERQRGPRGRVPWSGRCNPPVARQDGGPGQPVSLDPGVATAGGADDGLLELAQP